MITLLLGIALLVIGIVDWTGLFNITTMSLFGCVISALLFVVFDFLWEVTNRQKGRKVYLLAQITVVISLVIFPYISGEFPELVKANDALSIIGLGLVIITIAFREKNLLTRLIVSLIDLSKQIIKEKTLDSQKSIEKMESLNVIWENTIKQMEELYKQQLKQKDEAWETELKNVAHNLNEINDKVVKEYQSVIEEVIETKNKQMEELSVQYGEAMKKAINKIIEDEKEKGKSDSK